MKSFIELLKEGMYPKKHPDNWEATVRNRKHLKETALKAAKEDGAQVTDDGYIVLYHGTKSGPQIIKSGYLKTGTYLTSDIEIAKRYSMSAQGRGKAEVTTVIVDAQAIFCSGNKYYSTNEPVYYANGRYSVEPE